MARDACGVGQVVVSVDVALRTLQRNVGAIEREASLIVVESGIRP